MAEKLTGSGTTKTIAVSIVMTYFERRKQLANTLQSFDYHGYGPDVEVILIDDASVEQPIKEIDFGGHRYEIVPLVIRKEDKWYSNPCIPFNRGFRMARGSVVILQNAECLHHGNIVQHARTHLDRKVYLSYGCYSISRSAFDLLNATPDFKKRLEVVNFEARSMTHEGVDGWYNHSQYRPLGLHFCSGIKRDDLLEMGGFDERYSRGVAFDDNEFFFRLKEKGFRISFVDSPAVVHQWHYAGAPLYVTQWEKHKRNELLYKYMTQRHVSYHVVIVAWATATWLRRALRRVTPLVRLKRRLFKQAPPDL
jgi:GT2 family glycosyltransferase